MGNARWERASRVPRASNTRAGYSRIRMRGHAPPSTCRVTICSSSRRVDGVALGGLRGHAQWAAQGPPAARTFSVNRDTASESCGRRLSASCKVFVICLVWLITPCWTTPGRGATRSSLRRRSTRRLAITALVAGRYCSKANILMVTRDFAARSARLPQSGIALFWRKPTEMSMETAQVPKQRCPQPGFRVCKSVRSLLQPSRCRSHR